MASKFQWLQPQKIFTLSLQANMMKIGETLDKNEIIINSTILTLVSAHNGYGLYLQGSKILQNQLI